MSDASPRILVLGASGLIGHALATGLAREGFAVTGVARRWTGGQARVLERAETLSPVDLDPAGLEDLLSRTAPDLVVNCIGVLQDGPSGTTGDVHDGFAERLVAAIAETGHPMLLVQISVPGETALDRTAFSQSKRRAEKRIAASGIPFAILRPGFVVAQAAYGGSALIRALAALPLALPQEEEAAPFMSVVMADITATVRLLAWRWHDGERDMRHLFDLMHPAPQTVGSVVEAFGRLHGESPRRLRLPRFLLDLGARVGDLAARLGWRPPVRSTALDEMRRGVRGDPSRWLEWSGLAPTAPEAAIAALSSVQERWFARLYLAKAAILAILSLFWIASGLIALTLSFETARAIFVGLGWPVALAGAATIAGSLLDIAIGIGIAVRRHAKAALLAGIAVSLFYVAGSALFAPSLWLDPLGSMVKTVPAILLMASALAILDDR